MIAEGFPDFKIGDTVTIKVDGVEHSFVAFDNEGILTAGESSSTIGDGEGLDFAIHNFGYGDIRIYNLNRSNTSNTFSYIAKKIKTLNPKFVQGSGAFIIETEFADDNWLLSKASFALANQKALDGCSVYLQVGENLIPVSVFVPNKFLFFRSCDFYQDAGVFDWHQYTMSWRNDLSIPIESGSIYGSTTPSDQ